MKPHGLPEPHEVITLAVRRGDAARVEAHWRGRTAASGERVRRHRRRPPRRRDDHTATGEASPLQKFVPYLLAIDEVWEEGAEIVLGYLHAVVRWSRAARAGVLVFPDNRDAVAAHLSSGWGEGMAALLKPALPHTQRRQRLVRAISGGVRALLFVEQGSGVQSAA